MILVYFAYIFLIHICYHINIVKCDFSIVPQSEIFSGIYAPFTKFAMEPFASCWLITKRRFIQSSFEKMGNFEGAVFSILVDTHTVMTRDYFDFQVEHLSPTTNTLASHDLDHILISRLENRAIQLKNSIDIYADIFAEKSNTLAFIPFSCNGATTSGEDVKKMRIAMFKATFWSIYRYNIKLVISVSSPEDKSLLESFALPIFQIYEIYDVPPKDAWEQPKKMLVRAQRELKENKDWRDFEYVFYTDADQIVQMRSINKLYNVMEQHDLILTPHRLHVSYLNDIYYFIIK